jgi:hypothetical protein
MPLWAAAAAAVVAAAGFLHCHFLMITKPVIYPCLLRRLQPIAAAAALRCLPPSTHHTRYLLLLLLLCRVPDTSVLERFLDAEHLLLGGCREHAMADALPCIQRAWCLLCSLRCLHSNNNIQMPGTSPCYEHACLSSASFLRFLCFLTQVPDTSVLERFLDAEDLVLGRCRDQAMADDAWKEERERHWQRWGK